MEGSPSGEKKREKSRGGGIKYVGNLMVAGIFVGKELTESIGYVNI